MTNIRAKVLVNGAIGFLFPMISIGLFLQGRFNDSNGVQWLPRAWQVFAQEDGHGKDEMSMKGLGTSPEEKVVRDAYAKLMRYHTAIRDEYAETSGKSYRPEDYITYSIMEIETGLIRDVHDRLISDLVTPRSGETIKLKQYHLKYLDDPVHAGYDARWEKLAPGSVGALDKRTVRMVLQKDEERYNGVVRYTSYIVTASLEGKERTYRALALHYAPDDVEKVPKMEILDNVTSDMNVILAENSPRIISPWEKYIRSSLYRAIMRSIRRKEQAGQPLISPADPIGYLPGDEVLSNLERLPSTPIVIK